MATGTVVIDPGHGGTGSIGGSDGNHAVSASGVKEKDLTLILANLVRSALAWSGVVVGRSLSTNHTCKCPGSLSHNVRRATRRVASRTSGLKCHRLFEL